MIAASPSRTSSPVRLSSFSRSSFCSLAYLFTIEVSAARNPSSWVPPSAVLIVLANVCTDSAYDAVPLHRDLGRDPVALLTEVDDGGVHRLLGGVQVADEVGDAAVVAVVHRPRLARLAILARHGVLGPLVGQVDRQAAVQERHLLEPPGQRLEVPVRGLEDVCVRPEGDGGAGLVGGLAAGQRRDRVAELIALPPDVPVPADLHLQPGGQGVHHGHAHPVQAAGDGVGLAVELPARVQGGEHDLDGRTLFHRMLVDGDAAAVVGDPDPAVGEQGDVDAVAVPGQRLVYGVVHDLVDEVVQAALTGRADVHTGTLAYCLKALQDRDRTCVVGQEQAPLGRDNAPPGPRSRPARLAAQGTVLFYLGEPSVSAVRVAWPPTAAYPPLTRAAVAAPGRAL